MFQSRTIETARVQFIFYFVILAKAGIHLHILKFFSWIPAFAGMTERSV